MQNSQFKKNIKIIGGCSVAKAVRPSPPTAGVSSSRLDYSIWVSWWTTLSLGRFFLGFLPFPLSQISFHNFPTLISFVSFHFISSDPVVVRQAWSAGILAIHISSINGLHCISSFDTALCRIRIEDIYLIKYWHSKRSFSGSIIIHYQNYHAITST